MSTPPANVTVLLKAAAHGDAVAGAELLPLVYNELKVMAAAKLRHTPPGNTLQPTALVHEAFIKLLGADGQQQSWDTPGHFFGAAAKAMRDILVDHARRKNAAKRGGGRRRESLTADTDADDAGMFASATGLPDPDELLLIDKALAELEAVDSRKAEIVMLRYFAGLLPEQIAAALGTSERTVLRDWRFARLWLQRRVHELGGRDHFPAVAGDDETPPPANAENSHGG